MLSFTDREKGTGELKRLELLLKTLRFLCTELSCQAAQGEAQLAELPWRSLAAGQPREGRADGALVPQQCGAAALGGRAGGPGEPRGRQEGPGQRAGG